MYANDFDRFKLVLQKQGEVFGKPVTDVLISTYWEALKDQHIAAFERASDSHLRYGKFFPKPTELRPKTDKAPEPQDEKAIDAATEASIKSWEALRENKPATFWRQFCLTYIAQLGCKHRPESHEYRTALERCLSKCNEELIRLGEPPVDLTETDTHPLYRNPSAFKPITRSISADFSSPPSDDAFIF